MTVQPSSPPSQDRNLAVLAHVHVRLSVFYQWRYWVLSVVVLAVTGAAALQSSDAPPLQIALSVFVVAGAAALALSVDRILGRLIDGLYVVGRELERELGLEDEDNQRLSVFEMLTDPCRARIGRALTAAYVVVLSGSLMMLGAALAVVLST